MRNYILTEKEREILENWLETGEELPGYHTLKTRLTQNFYPLSEDIKIITWYLIKIESNLPADSRAKTNSIKTWVLEYMREAAPDKIPDVNGILDKLSNQTRLLSAALENNPEATIILDRDFCILYVNDAFTRMTGMSREKFMGLVVTDFYKGHDYGSYKNLLKTEGSLRDEIPVTPSNEGGRISWVEFNASCFRQGSGVLAYIVTMRDVTEKKRMESELTALLEKITITGKS